MACDWKKVFEDLEIDIDDFSGLLACDEVVQSLAERTDFNYKVAILIDLKLEELADRLCDLEEAVIPCIYDCLYGVEENNCCYPFYNEVETMPTSSFDPGVEGDWSEDGIYLAYYKDSQWWFIEKLTI